MTASQASLLAQVQRCNAASRQLRLADGNTRNAFLKHLGEGIARASSRLLEANARDLAAAEHAGMPQAMRDRLALNESRIGALADNCREVMALPDPVGQITQTRTLPSGLRLERRRIPLGVLMLIYEARPNATIEASVLALKSGNAIVLRGGSEAEHSNRALGEVLHAALDAAGLPRDAIALLLGASREDTVALLQRSEWVDLVIPRGGAALIETVRKNARMPMLAHGPGICHVYVDATADEAQAIAVAVDSKADRPSTCNSAETLLVHAAIAESFLPKLARAYLPTGGEIRACARAAALLFAPHRPASEQDFATEHLANILNLKVVDDLGAALAHIDRFGTRHTEAIVTESLKIAERFCRDVDASCVLVNASTRLNDGFCLGLGAELGISTSKFHAFGPMGLEALTIEKNVAVGDGQTRR